MRPFKTVLLIAALLAAIFILYNQYNSPPVVSSAPAPPADSATALDTIAPSNQLTKENTASQSAQSDSVELVNSDAAESTQSELTNGAESASLSTPSQPNPDYPEMYGYEVGVANISEDEFHALVKRLRNDPALMEDVLNELRAETDPVRIKRLSALLGETGSAAVLPVTEELIYSSEPAIRKAGLDILSRVAPRNPAAYDMANTILGSEADPAILVSTMNVMATPKNASAEVRATAISQIMPLANHEEVAVRRHSVSILVRLTNDETLSPVLYEALSDTDASVREAAVYAYADYPYQTTEAVERLLEISEDPNEERGVRSGAILALSKMSPDEQMQARIDAAKTQMREALRAK